MKIRRMAAHEWPAYRAIRLRSLAEAPDAFCQTLASAEALMHEVWQARLIAAAQSSSDYPLFAEIEGRQVGLVWAKVDQDDAAVVNLFQVWVAPEARGRSVAAGLIRDALGWAAQRGSREVRLSVTCGDAPARRLYEREGFVAIGEPAPREGTAALMEQMMVRVL
jgi:GNAT superfamily N-acetyltransferase